MSKWHKKVLRIKGDNMMDNDLISRQAAIELSCNVPIAPMIQGEGIHYEDIIFTDHIKSLPIVQLEQKTGRWEHDGGHFANRWICSQCGYKFYFEKSEAKYCPNCGAKMESDNND